MGVLLYALDRYGGCGYVPDRYDGSGYVPDRYDGSGSVSDRYDGGDRQRHCTQRSSVVFDRYGGCRNGLGDNGKHHHFQ